MLNIRKQTFVTVLVALAVFVSALAVVSARAAAQTRVYYIAADEVTWNYVPGGVNGLTGKQLDAVGYFTGKDGSVFTKPVGTTYAKCLYRRYADGTFRRLRPRPPRWRHLGFLGPVIRAEVGDTIRIVYRNNCSFPNSIHAHGVFYAKSSEGAPYDDGIASSAKPGDSVAPGATFTYVWQVPKRAGPGPSDPNSILWMYHSHVNAYRDVNSGLMGPIIITAQGQAKSNGTPKGVDREFVVDFAQIHEEDSWYVNRNLPTIATDHAVPTPLTESSATVTYPYFVTFSINGYSFSSMPKSYLTMRKGEHVRWYVMTGLNDFDAHAPHWHGQTVEYNGTRTDVITLEAMQMVVADMVPDDVGTWLFHCAFDFHNEAGMNALFTVLPSERATSSRSKSGSGHV